MIRHLLRSSMTLLRTFVLCSTAFLLSTNIPAQTPPQVKTANGIVQGTIGPSGIRAFKGIPYASPPVGDLRWREPQPAKNWTGIRSAERFAAQCMQRRVFSDMVFRASGMSEDCLYLERLEACVGRSPARTGLCVWRRFPRRGRIRAAL